ncbi:MAG: hypothetical protein NTV81_04805 [Candidatus Komeilibacteria bacterium]|nr:hypothetical protein [Candidatus Komeilibacteria bacterium]
MKIFLLKKYLYFLSYFKKDWTLKDYPLIFKNDSKKHLKINLSKRFKPILWRAMVLGWPQMQGDGDTKEEAMSDLQNKFYLIKKSEEAIPRPGTDLPIIFSSSKEVQKYFDLASDFFNKILEVDYNQVFISDESSIWDFIFDESLDMYYKKIKDIYDVDVSDTDGNFLKIFKKIIKK